MLRILIVEDEQSKKQQITKIICATRRVSLDNLIFADNVRDARRSLAQYRFDLVVLDLNVPRSSAGKVEVGAGLDVLAFIRNNVRAIAPGYVLGLTAYDDAFASAVDSFECALWKLMRFSHTSTTWENALREAVHYLADRQSPPYATDGTTHHCDVAIATALEEELKEVLCLPCDWEKLIVPYDHAQYYKGSATIGGQPISFVATVASRMGMTSMAISATKLVTAFHPRLLASTGLCAGVRGKTSIGDVLVADPCFDWGSGKWIRGERNALKFLPAHYQWRLDARLAHAARETAHDKEFVNKLHADFTGPKPAAKPLVFVDAMASGASVLQVAEMMSEVREQHKNLIGIEMENYAVFAAAEGGTEPRPMCITVKSVCDFGDEDKNNEYRSYAAHTSTAFFWRLLHHRSTLEVGRG